MDSKETQVNTFDADLFQNGLDDLRHQLAIFNLSHEAVNIGLDTKHSGLKHMHEKLMNLGKHFTSFMGTLTQIQDQIDDNQGEIRNLDNEYEELCLEKEHLEQQQKELFSEERFHDISKKLSEGNASLVEKDLDVEQHLIQFTNEDLMQRMLDLNDIRERTQQKHLQHKTEWEGFKEDLKECRLENRPYIDEMEHLNSLVMSRLRGIEIHSAGGEEKEMIGRTIRYLQLDKEFRERQEKFIDSQIVSRDLQDEIAELLIQRQALWKQNEKLEHEIDQLEPDVEKTGFLLHQSEPCQNLPQRDEGPEDYLGSDLEKLGENEVTPIEPEHHCGGKMLHRCSKITNIPLVIQQSESMDPVNETTKLSDDGETQMEQDKEEEDNEIEPRKENEPGIDKNVQNQKFEFQPGTLSESDDDEMVEDVEDSDFTPFLDAKLKCLLGAKSSGSDFTDKDKDYANMKKKQSGTSDTPSASPDTSSSRVRSSAIHGVTEAPQDASIISKVRTRLGAPSTSSKNILESRGIAAGAAPLAKQSSAKYGESTFTMARRARRK